MKITIYLPRRALSPYQLYFPTSAKIPEESRVYQTPHTQNLRKDHSSDSPHSETWVFPLEVQKYFGSHFLTRACLQNTAEDIEGLLLREFWGLCSGIPRKPVWHGVYFRLFVSMSQLVVILHTNWLLETCQEASYRNQDLVWLFSLEYCHSWLGTTPMERQLALRKLKRPGLMTRFILLYALKHVQQPLICIILPASRLLVSTGLCI